MECDISISNVFFFLFQMTSNLPQFASHSDKQKIRECPPEMLNYRRKSLEKYTILETALKKKVKDPLTSFHVNIAVLQ